MKRVFWYFGVVIAVGMLVLSFLAKNWILTGITVLVSVVLSKTNASIDLPKIYEEHGISNRHFESKRKGRKHEKNN